LQKEGRSFSRGEGSKVREQRGSVKKKALARHTLNTRRDIIPTASDTDLIQRRLGGGGTKRVKKNTSSAGSGTSFSERRTIVGGFKSI